MTRHGPGKVRIIGGRLRRRLVPVPAVPGLRPTGDRIRETLFNWLGERIAGLRCLDLFAGSGVLGLEALSRGAARVVLVERHPLAVQGLREVLAALGETGAAQVVQADALAWLAGAAEPFDLVFLDPPFGEPLVEPACARLEAGGWLADGALVYLEAPRDAAPPALPASWSIIHNKNAGQVCYRLAERAARGTTT